MAIRPLVDGSGLQPLVLCGSVVAVALAKAHDEICRRMLMSDKAAAWADARELWQYSQTLPLIAYGRRWPSCLPPSA